MTHYDYPIINVNVENEHFDLSDSIISWMENCKSSRDEDPKESISNILPPPPMVQHQASAPNIAWNLVRIFGEKQGLSRELVELASTVTTISGHQQFNDSIHPLSFNSDDEQLSNKFAQVKLQVELDSSSPMIKSQPSSAIQDKNNSSNLETLSNYMIEQSATSSLTTDDLAFKNSSMDLVESPDSNIRMRGNDEWAPPRAQIIFNIHEETNFRKLMQKQNYRCAGCGTKIDLELARRLVLFCHYLGKYFCKCCFSRKAIHLPGYILQKWNFNKYPVSHFALQLLDRIANEPLFNINDINSSLYKKVKKLKHLIDIRMQLYYLKIYITTCPQADKLNNEYITFTQQHLLQDDAHVYSLNNLIEVQHGKLYEYLNDLVSRSIAHIAQCDRCRAKGHYCQLCGPSSLVSSMILSNCSGAGGFNQLQLQQQQQLSQTTSNSSYESSKLNHSTSVGQNLASLIIGANKDQQSSRQQSRINHSRSSSGTYSNFSTTLQQVGVASGTSSVPIDDHEVIFPFEIGRVAQCRACGCCFHLQCFLEAGQNCPKCERIQRRKAEDPSSIDNSICSGAEAPFTPVTAT